MRVIRTASQGNTRAPTPSEPAGSHHKPRELVTKYPEHQPAVEDFLGDWGGEDGVQNAESVDSTHPRVLISGNGYYSAGVNLTVELLRIVEHLDGEGFFFAGELEAGWYSP